MEESGEEWEEGRKMRWNEVALKLGQVYSVTMSPLLICHPPTAFYRTTYRRRSPAVQTVAIVYFHLLSSSPRPPPLFPVAVIRSSLDYAATWYSRSRSEGHCG